MSDEQLLVVVTERTPTEDRTDINSYHYPCDGWLEVTALIESFWLNFGVLVSIQILPHPQDPQREEGSSDVGE